MKQKVYRDPVCHKKINRQKAQILVQYKGYKYLLCCPLCQSEFEKNPEKYANPEIAYRIQARKKERGRRIKK